ncbi:polysaccharide biosynthesis protein [Natronospira bacteriovora]|uniref:Nucleoside-diphosphate sugar epimerase/dehydratase n=1 Tax=Natronospira bacteriovora TaxID=3069753 RepID=A0ABU0W7I0_9GAMM|nr:nucleoside-diphosphate sugar epimerase/dehydratase [Natronospira sp. AB-CW4]MDQ2069893.1 nucleoside-diphosphate sugar epimerase/dehydratase [Natronospira sp. AB-CW4]
MSRQLFSRLVSGWRPAPGWSWRRFAIMAHDAAWIPLVLFIAYQLRLNFGEIPAHLLPGLLALIAFATPIQALSFWVFGCYRGVWRFASMPDLIRLGKAIAVGTAVTMLCLFLFNRLAGVPRSVLILYPILLLVATGGPRAIYRILRERGRRYVSGPMSERALVVGAGRGGELLVRDLVRNTAIQPVALLDDDPAKLGEEIHGVRVRGHLDDLPRLARRFNATLVIIAMPSATRATFKRVVALAADARIPCRTMPSLDELLRSDSSAAEVRPVLVEDLLGRESINLDDDSIRQDLQGRRVLVTGAGGSIGSELCRRLLSYGAEKLIVLDHSEYNLYRIDHELMTTGGARRVEAVLTDTRDRRALEEAFARYRPDVVFHAGAFKHVPLLEQNVLSAVDNNVFGTRNVADLAVAHGVGRVVLISTDKTVNPTNVMGATKRVAELYCQMLNRQSEGTRFVVTRFGNVLESAGSVIPLFRRQIEAGGPVTVTHPEVRRYFMTLEEATGLILQASAISRGGEVYVLDMGEPIAIRELAESMIRLYGHVPGQDVEIQYTGLRPGEKLQEELFYESESLQGTVHPKLLLAREPGAEDSKLLDSLGRLESAVASRHESKALSLLHDIVPGFQILRIEAPPARLKIAQ